MHSAQQPIREFLKQCQVSERQTVWKSSVPIVIDDPPDGIYVRRHLFVVPFFEVEIEHTQSSLCAIAGTRCFKDGRHIEDARRRAIHRLRVTLACHMRSKDTQFQPSELWRQTLINGWISIPPTHRDAPALFVDAFDALSISEWKQRKAAQRLGVRTGSLYRFVQGDPIARRIWNEHRRASGLPIVSRK